MDMERIYQEAARLLREMCAIPAPAGGERTRAEYARSYWTEKGAKNVYVDGADNCVWQTEGDGPYALFCAHTDTVFPDTQPMPMTEENGVLKCPGCGDDTANLAVLMAVTGAMLEEKRPLHNVIFAADSGEEGLGNLKGIRAIMERYRGRIRYVVSFDCHLGFVTDGCVGSERYRMTLRTQGGHSYFDYGRPSAVHEMAKIVCEIYESPLPEGKGTATKNVGVFEGGTSVNAIPQTALALYEHRSDDRERLDALRADFERITAGKAGLTVENIGNRPCKGDVDEAAQRALVERCLMATAKHTGAACRPQTASTDCNVPLSMGVPACCAGLVRGGGMHTREEWVEVVSLKTGIQVALDILAPETGGVK